MKIIFRLLFITACFILSSGCSDNNNKNPIVGTWELVSWTVDIPFEIENKVTTNLNFLEKTTCKVNETLTFDHLGNVTSEDTFSPKITIRLKDDLSNNYIIDEICAEGIIGFSTEYLQIDDKNIEFNGAEGVFTARELTLVYANAIKIYNEALTEIIDNKDLTLVYSKK